MFYKIFRSPQAKRCPTIINKHGIYELRHELPNDLRRTTLDPGPIPPAKRRKSYAPTALFTPQIYIHHGNNKT